jgi:hypothetical protein
MAQAVYVDEDGSELWQSQWGEYTPAGTVVTGPEGRRYLVAHVDASPDGAVTDADLTITVRALSS